MNPDSEIAPTRCYPRITIQTVKIGKMVKSLSLESRLLKQVDLKYSKIVSKLQILSDKGDITFHIDQKRKILPFLSFPRAAILDFMTSLRRPIVSYKRTSN